MRILHVDKFIDGPLYEAGGVATYVRALMGGMRRRGHETRLFGTTTDAARAEMPRFFDFAASRSPLALPRMIHNAAAAAKLEAFLRRRPADVAHLHNIYHHLTPSILPVLARRGIGIVMTVHDYRLACPTKHFLRPDGACMRCAGNRFYHAAGPRCAGAGGLALVIETLVQRFSRRYFRWVDLFLCPTDFIRRVLLGCGLPAGKAVVLRNPVAPVACGPADKRDEDVDLLFAGRLSGEKGPLLMADLAELLPEAKVAIIGDGPLRAELQRLVRRRRLRNVTLPGAVPHERIGQWFARSRVFVLPSRCIENSPAALLEAMSCGLCVLAADHPPLREWVADGRTGRLFAAGDGPAAAAAARELLADPQARRRMGAAGRRLVARRHDTRRILDQLEAHYRKAIGRCALR